MKKCPQLSDQLIVRPWIIIFLPLILHSISEAALRGQVIQMARKIQMSSSDPLPEKEYFINIGKKDGLKVGDVLKVSREIAVSETMSEGKVFLMQVVLGEISVFLVDNSVSAGRLNSIRGPAELPPLEYSTFMIGDLVELKSDYSHY